MLTAPSSLTSITLATALLLATPDVDPPPEGEGLWGDVTCESSASGCELGAGDLGDGAEVEGGAEQISDEQAGATSSGTGASGPVCETYPDTQGAVREYWVSEHGLRPDQRLVLRICDPGGPEWLVLEADAEFVATAVGPSAADLAESARDRLSLPAVGLGMSPVGDQLVGLPTWLWIDTSGWVPVSRTVSVPGVSVTATATPMSVVWSTGDGGSVVCEGPGTPYTTTASPEAPSPDCGHTYREVSPEGGFTVSATVRWSVEWAGAGESGVFPGLETAASAAVEVAQAPAVNVVPGGAR